MWQILLFEEKLRLAGLFFLTPLNSELESWEEKRGSKLSQKKIAEKENGALN